MFDPCEPEPAFSNGSGLSVGSGVMTSPLSCRHDKPGRYAWNILPHLSLRLRSIQPLAASNGRGNVVPLIWLRDFP